MSLIKLLEKATEYGRRSPHEAFTAFCKLAACALSAGRREDEYLEEVKRWERETLHVFCEAFAVLIQEMDSKWFTDLLGPIHMEWGSKAGHQRGGEFYTPQSLSKCLAQMSFSVDSMPKDRPLSLMEPCCGSGGMVLSLAEVLADNGISVQRMKATCIDVSRLACDMCYINTTLWGIPAVVIHGNALSMETWATWTNPFWNMAQGDTAFQLLSALTGAQEAIAQIESDEAPPKATVAPDITLPTADKRGQFSFELEAV